MSVPIVLRSAVYDELTAAADWYDENRVGLGNELLEETDAALNIVAERPESFPIVWKDVRRVLLRRFPYAIYFKVEGKRVLVMCFVHTARSPRFWKKRTRE